VVLQPPQQESVQKHCRPLAYFYGVSKGKTNAMQFNILRIILSTMVWEALGSRERLENWSRNLRRRLLSQTFVTKTMTSSTISGDD
jgi:hypothetical protein